MIVLNGTMEKNDHIILDLTPVGVRTIGKNGPVPEGIDQFHGVSYCQAVLRATFGKEVLLGPGSIQVCKWAPVVLGLKHPENAFEKTINRRFPEGTAPLLIAPILHFRGKRKPEVVIIRAKAEALTAIIEALGHESFIPHKDFKRDETALPVFATGPQKGFSPWAIRNVNRWLNWMNGFGWWQGMTTFLFRSIIVTRLFDRFITKFMANMSLCRNSTVIPGQTGLANISFFCTGGIAWGKNPSDFMTAGFPYGLYKKIERRLRFPGLPGYDYVSAGSDKVMERMLHNASKIKGCVQ